MGFNKVILEGRLTKDIELRYSNSGVAMAKSTIAVSKKFTVNGEKKEKTLFVNIQLWKKSAEIFNQYCRKGSHILIEGELENNDYEDSQGQKKYGFIVNVSNLQMLGSKDSTQPEQQQSYQQPSGQTNHTAYKQPQKQMPDSRAIPEIDIDESMIPF